MDDILDRIDDLIKQATTEKSHYYTAAVLKEAAGEIRRLRSDVEDAIEYYLRRAER